MTKKIEGIVDDVATGTRLDVYLTKEMPDMSRAHIQKMISDGNVFVNGKIVKANYKVKACDNLEFYLAEPQELAVKPEAIPLDILYEDQDMIVINKQRGLVVHPAAGNYHGTLVNALLAHCQDLSGINGEIRPGIVHRLDKDTSGVMVAAKNDRAHVNLAKQIKDKTATRSYIAIVHGNISEEQGVINAPIGRHPVDRKKMAVVFTNSKEAITHFKVLERFGKFTVIACRLETGRTHQIRVHMAYIGHPVVADPKYGPRQCPFPIAGQALHSKELILAHPVTGEKMMFMAPIPQDMEGILALLREQRRGVQ